MVQLDPRKQKLVQEGHTVQSGCGEESEAGRMDKANLQTGRFKYNDGGWYVGQHCGDGKRHGNGIYTYPNGDVFDGSFIMGK